jgi:formylglycine-generating enzyme required for sulfatase activity
MAGNVWEVLTSSFKKYPDQSNEEEKDFTINDFDVPWRGGSYYQNSTSVRCGARFWYHPDGDGGGNGFRVVVAPRSH